MRPSAGANALRTVGSAMVLVMYDQIQTLIYGGGLAQC